MGCNSYYDIIEASLKNMSFTYFSKNGNILPVEQATISLFNIEYSYGFGVYETLKVRNGIVYFVDQHLERLEQSAKTIGLVHELSQEQIKDFISQLLKQEADNSACNIKLVLIGGNSKEKAQLFIFLSAPLFPDRKLYSHGAKTVTAQYERLFPHAKTLNMLGSYLAYKKARENNCYDALLLDQKNNIIEGTRTNFFAIKDMTIITPPKEKVLEGVTKITVLDTAQKNGFRIEEKEISFSEVKNYDGVFLTSTSIKIMPITQIDEVVFSQIPGNLKKLLKLYDDFLDASKGIFVQ
jgi:branched-subunit amino acid aminotransferase/4-amino-4-deoxychorismate lyase